MAQIVQRIVNWTPDGALELRGETWSRKLPFGNNWSKMRLVVIATIGEATVGTPFLGGVTTTAAGFFTGVCDSRNPFGYTSDSSFGISWFGDPTPPWTTMTLTLNTGGASFGPYYTSNVSPFWFYKTYDPNPMVGSNLVGTTFSSSGAMIFPHNSAPRRRSVFGVEITRSIGGGGPATNYIYFTSSAVAPADVTMADAVDLAAQSSGGSVGNITLTTANNATQLHGEAFNVLDAVFVHWANNVVPLYIHGIVACCWYESLSPELGLSTQMGASEGFSFHGTTSGTWTPPVDSYTPVSVSFLGGVPGWDVGVWYDNGTSANLLPQYGAIYGTSSGNPMDTFTQYVITTNGSQATGALNAGTGFAAPWVSVGTQGYTAERWYGASGTSSNQPALLNDQWADVGTISAGEQTGGYGWSSAAIFNGSWASDRPNADFVFFGYGTTGGNPNDQFLQYITGGTVTSGVTDAGTNWGSPIYLGGTNTDSYEANPWDFAGTAQRFPWETFSQYDTGTIGTTVFITAGTGWGSDGTIHTGPF